MRSGTAPSQLLCSQAARTAALHLLHERARVDTTPAPAFFQARPTGKSAPRRPSLNAVTRYVIDAPTLLHIVDNGLSIEPTHQLVAPNTIRSEALQLLLDDVRRGARTDKEALDAHER